MVKRTYDSFWYTVAAAYHPTSRITALTAADAISLVPLMT